MNLDSFDAALSRIVNLISSLNTANLNSNLQQILDITENFGPTSELHVFHTYLHQFQWSTTSDPRSSTASLAKEKDIPTLICSENSPGLLTSFLNKYSRSLPPARFISDLSSVILLSPLLNKVSFVLGSLVLSGLLDHIYMTNINSYELGQTLHNPPVVCHIV
ncbi:hypothetical protein FHG87_009107 [Trinorchestia longiramus]|nr:hypothetical protein FHG87_009107 [Trinorchestia longiramus]